MGNYTILGLFENPRRGRQLRNLTTNVPKSLDLKSSSEQIFSENCRWVPLMNLSVINVSVESILLYPDDPLCKLCMQLSGRN